MSEAANDVAVQMRAGLRRLAKAVVVITSQHESQRYAMAATAVSEVSMDPPSLLICVNSNASIHTPLSAGAGFCINILHSSQEAISAVCSGQERGEMRFQQGAWAQSKSGLPYLEDAQASFMCRNDRRGRRCGHERGCRSARLCRRALYGCRPG